MITYTVGDLFTNLVPGSNGSINTTFQFLAGDFDHDGDDDLSFWTGSGDAYYRNNGNGTLTYFANLTGTPFEGLAVAPNYGPSNTVLADFDNDGDRDILYFANGTHTYLTYDGTHYVTGTSPFAGLTSATQNIFLPGDFDNDGDVDLVAWTGTQEIYYRNNGSGAFTSITDMSLTPFAGVPVPAWGPQSTRVADFDGDNDQDILFFRGDTDQFVYLRNNGGNYSQQASPFPALSTNGTDPNTTVVGDFDSDGDVDVLFWNGSAEAYYRNNGGGSYTLTTDLSTTPFAGLAVPPAFGPDNMEIADFDADGDIDILLYRAGDHSTYTQNGAPPRLVSSTPADNAGSVSTSANVTLTFNENVFTGAGNITLRRASDNAIVETFAGNDARVTGSGTAALTIDFATTLAGSTGYYLQFATGAIRDADGMTFGRLDGVQRVGITDSQFLNFTTAAANTAPTVGANLELTLAEGASGTIGAGLLDFNDTEQSDAAITYTVTSVATNGTLFRNGVALGLNATFTQADVNANLISYTHNGGETTSASFGFSVSDGAGGSIAGQTFTITVTPVDDAGVAQDDTFATDEATAITAGNVFANNGAGADNDPDSTLTVTKVNGVGADVGTQVTLASGALLTLNANGTFDYDPNGAFDDLPGSLSGASNLLRDDTFTYTLSDGDTATVTITVAGLDGDGDVLLGTAGPDILIGGILNDKLYGLGGNDTLAGGTGDDLYFVYSATDTIIETAGNGAADRVSAFVSFALAADDDVEILTTGSSTGKAAIDLRGNALSQAIVGNDGKNVLHDGGVGGADKMVGRDGNDTYIVYNSADVIVEKAGEGIDRVSAGVDYALAKGVHVELLNTTAADATYAVNLTGNAFAQTIRGNAGDNVLSDGGTGAADTLIGGKGNDDFQVYNSGDVIVELDGEGADRVSAAVDFVLTAGAHIEYLNTTALASTYAVNLTGNEFVQLVRGNDGANTIDGGGGEDVLFGMGGVDNFRFSTALGPTNVAVIADYQAGTDKIHLDDAIFTALGALGALDAAAFKDTATGAKDVDDRIIYNSDTGALAYDADGSGTAFTNIRFATITGSPLLTAADFVVV
ncbi:FG-GAP-like repeat-containing protein [Mesorhizobium sp. IMUNJ 23232]|uniref:FG-GAP-like repeat-containing protein n=1 Tax=Mesorhizobium sp. IMUNJ 23232 TaxID=3376064 RepID=UPI00379CBAEE